MTTTTKERPSGRAQPPNGVDQGLPEVLGGQGDYEAGPSPDENAVLRFARDEDEVEAQAGAAWEARCGAHVREKAAEGNIARQRLELLAGPRDENKARLLGQDPWVVFSSYTIPAGVTRWLALALVLLIGVVGYAEVAANTIFARAATQNVGMAILVSGMLTLAHFLTPLATAGLGERSGQRVQVVFLGVGSLAMVALAATFALNFASGTEFMSRDVLQVIQVVSTNVLGLSINGLAMRKIAGLFVRADQAVASDVWEKRFGQAEDFQSRMDPHTRAEAEATTTAEEAAALAAKTKYAFLALYRKSQQEAAASRAADNLLVRRP